MRQAQVSYQRALQIAEELAKFLNLGLSDSSRCKEVFREVDTLDESICEHVDGRGELLRQTKARVRVAAKCA